MPAAMAPIVSVSPPRLALMTAACHGSPLGDLQHREGGRNRFLAGDAGADEIDDQPDAVDDRLAADESARPVDARGDVAAGGPVAVGCAAASQRQTALVRSCTPVAAGNAAADSGSTAAAEAMAIEVLCVARQVSATWRPARRAAPAAS